MKNCSLNGSPNKKHVCILAMILMLAAAMAFAGCGKNKKDDSDDSQEESTQTEASESDDEPEVLDGEGEPANPEKMMEAGLDSYGDSFGFIGFSQGDAIYAIDYYGNVIASYEKADIFKQFDLPEDATFVENQGPVVFLESSSNEENSESEVIACDLISGEKSTIIKTQDQIQSIEVWNGILYIDLSSTDFDTGYFSLSEHAYIREGDEGAAYKETESDADEMLKQAATDGYRRETTSRFNDCYIFQCAARELESEDGILLYNNDGNDYYLMKETGSYEKLDIPDENCGISGRDSSYVVYSTCDENYVMNGLFLYNMSDGSSTALTDYCSYFLGIFGGNVYWNVNYNNENVMEQEYHAFAYSIDRDESTELYVLKRQPGFSYQVDFGTADFSRVNDIAAVLQPSGNNMEWNIITPANDGYKMLKTGITACTAIQDGYGTIEVSSDTVDCDKCGNLVAEFYYELLKLNLDEDGCEPINEQLEAMLNDSREYFDDARASMDNESCEDHEAGRWIYTYDTSVTDIKRIGDHYISIEIDSYEYSGGAHGYPINNNLLFDLDTGKRVYAVDLYEGTVDELAEIVASKAKAMAEEALENGEYIGFYSDDPDEVYTEAKDNFTSDIYTRFEDDGVVFAYSPYSIGPYASGYIEVKVPYTDLGFTL